MEGLAAEARDGGTFGPESSARDASGSKTTTAMPEQDVEVAVINADGTGREDLARSRAFDASPAFSPGGDKIVFSRMGFDESERSGKSGLVVMRSDDANKSQITDTPPAFEYGADWQPLPPETAGLD